MVQAIGNVKILIDINHPCHVHLFKNFFKQMKAEGHKVIVTCKRIPSAIYLLKYYGIPFILINFRSDSIIGKGLSGILQNLHLFWLVIKNGIDVGIGTSMNLAHVAKITRMYSIILDDDDDEVEPLFVRFVHPFADAVLSPTAVKSKRQTSKAVFYPGYHELAYLHPEVFTPNPGILDKLKINFGENYFILRFNSFKAHHDVGEKGLSIIQKKKLIETLIPLGKVFITTEREIDEEFRQYQIWISPEDMHDALYYASLFAGDSQTMTSEAAVLGTPALRCNSFVGRIAYLEEEERKYGLTFGFRPEDFNQMINKIKEILSNPGYKSEWQVKREAMLRDKINTTKYLTWLVKGFPQSINLTREEKIVWSQFK